MDLRTAFAVIPQGVGHRFQWLRELIDRQAAVIERRAEELREASERTERREATWLRQPERMTAPLPAPTPVFEADSLVRSGNVVQA